MANLKHTIKIKCDCFVEEYIANAAITPGMLVELISTGKIRKHATAGGSAEGLFAVEDEFQGKGIDDAYVANTPVQCWVVEPGDQVNALLDDGENVVIGDFLESAGNGFLQKYSSAASNNADAIDRRIIAVALEAVNLASSSGTWPDADRRIIVRIV